MNASAEPAPRTVVSRSRAGRILVLVGRLALAAVFLVAAYAKLRPQVAMPWSITSVKTSLAMFAMEVDSYQLLPPAYVSAVAHLLPPFELFLGLWLLSGIAQRFSALASTLLIAGLFTVVVRTYALGLSINCGCFGPGEQLGTTTLIRDGSLLALSAAVTAGAFLLRRGRGAAPIANAAPVPQRAE
jgi:uncharacterized membrane protein YphA (DoxX/SURF4 family)